MCQFNRAFPLCAYIFANHTFNLQKKNALLKANNVVHPEEFNPLKTTL